MQKGVIFDIKEFAIYDGPGMRQTVFLKGCPLRCNWCHNPEGLSNKPQLMVSTASCTHCGKCIKACPLVRFNGKQSDFDPTAIDMVSADMQVHGCTTCGKCIEVCPLHLRNIAGMILNSDELVEKIRENSDYYDRYGGGVTFSGGEPLYQSEFLIEVLDKIPDLHRAMETSGYASAQTFDRVVNSLDYVLMDLKVFDSDIHKKYTGVDNTIILQNIRRLSEGNTPFVIRIPVIPGVNDNEDNFRKTAQWIAGSKNLQKVELLPYHKTAGAKYEMAGLMYQPIFDVNERVHIPADIFKEYGIRSEVL